MTRRCVKHGYCHTGINQESMNRGLYSAAGISGAQGLAYRTVWRGHYRRLCGAAYMEIDALPWRKE